MDLARQIHYAALDTLGEVAYSQQLGFLEHDRDQSNFLKINEQMLSAVLMVSNYDWFFPILHHWPLSYLLPRAGDSAGFGAIMG